MFRSISHENVQELAFLVLFRAEISDYINKFDAIAPTHSMLSLLLNEITNPTTTWLSSESLD